MYCLVFVTVCKTKIPHKGCYFTYGNIVMKTKIVFLLQIKLTKTPPLAVTHTYQLREY